MIDTLPTNITKLPQPASASPLYRGYEYEIEPFGDRWTITVVAPGGMRIHPGNILETRGMAETVARETIDRIVEPGSMPGSVAMTEAMARNYIDAPVVEAQRADPKAMPGCAGMMDAITEGTVTR